MCPEQLVEYENEDQNMLQLSSIQEALLEKKTHLRSLEKVVTHSDQSRYYFPELNGPLG